MYIKNNKSQIFLTKDRFIDSDPILFLHGFSGSSNCWTDIRKEISAPTLALDVPGHNKSYFLNLDEEYTYKDFRSELFLILNHINVKKVHLLGYSMGGRLAISFTQKYPELVKSLILESSSLGLVSHDEKEAQIEKDDKLLQLINTSMDEFVSHWSKNPLFINQESRNKDDFNKLNENRLKHSKDQLSKSLLSLSKANMPAFIEAFSTFDCPVYLINGKEDTKYIKINRDMMKVNKRAKQFIINNSSHNVHIENKNDFILTVNNILKDFS